MPSTAQLPALLPALPELVLAGGALLLLMVGAYRGERSTPVVALGAIMLLIAGIVIVVWLPGGKTTTFGGSFILDDFARFLKVLAFGGSAAAILMSQNYLAREKPKPLRISGADPARDDRHGHDDLGRRSDRALSRPRADEPLALCARRRKPRFHPLERSGFEIFRPRRLVVRNAAVWLLADLRLYRHRCRFRRSRKPPRRAGSA